jgi:REP element-mobilizing transposase RayT
VDKYVVMPNHVHLILVISDSLEKAPSVSRVVQQFKRAVSIHLGKSVWQEGFYDHVIRGDADYREIWTYIDNNPVKWARDKYYREG